MRNSVLSIVKVLLMLSALNGCSSGGKDAATADIRQAGVTISTSPVFPYDPLSANQYTLLVSNHTTQEVSLVDSKILNSSLPESVNLSEIVYTSSCQEIAAGANCSLSVKLPYVKTNGYLDFSLDYQDKLTAKNYPITKLIAFSRNITENNGMLYSLKYSERIIVNSDKFTFALPLSLKQDYAKLELQLAGQKASGYSAINCDHESSYSKYSNCTAIVELDGHIAYPKLSLKTTDKNGLENIINLNLSVVFNNTAHLIYLNAPLIVRATDAPLNVTVVNIGTATATNVTTPWTPSATIDLTLTRGQGCVADLKLNATCQLSYKQELGESGGVGMQQQTINYFGGAQGVQTDKFNVYRNSAALIVPSIDSIYIDNIKYQRSAIVVDNAKPVITVRFTQAVNSNTINNQTFYLSSESDTTTPLAGSIVFRESGVITFTPTDDLIRGGAYKFTLKTGQIGNSAGKVDSDQNATEEVEFTIKQPTITIIPDSAEQVIMGDSFRFTARINDTTSQTISLVVNAEFVDPSVVGTISSTPGSCELNAGSGTKSCSFTATINKYESWDPAKLGNGLTDNYQIKVSATGSDIKLIGESLSFSMNTPTVYLAATGQTTSYVTGDDGNYNAGVTVNPRFTTVGDCITDNLTGLMWVRDLSGVNGGQATTWQNGLNLIDTANASNAYCGYNDWYLPTLNDLSSLTNYSQKSSVTWLNTLGFKNLLPDRSFYSSTTYTNRMPWISYFNWGSTGVVLSTDNYYILPVRMAKKNTPAKIPVTGENNGVRGSASGESWPQPRFIVGNESGASANCVTDKLTGLMWVRDLNTVEIINSPKNGESTTWENAISSVEKANYCGYTDWRLPNVTELKSLINYGESNPATSQVFANVSQKNGYWSSTSYAFNDSLAWYVPFRGDGGVNVPNKTNNNYVWPVRGGRQP
ncbi:MAG: DUF1566 domain-containing protein [Burkholderiales bacterium]|nr:DUF1566 domain-containing protein [Burkholderiales bacterium]